MHARTRRNAVRWIGACAACLLPSAGCAQISLATAVNLALTNDNRVKLAQADLSHAKAVLAETKETFVPAVAATGGVGKSTGAPLSPPVVFNIAGQSLVYNASQRDFLRAAGAGVESAQLALDAARSDVAEDVASTYVTLDNALARRAVQGDALGFAGRLVSISQERFEAGVDSHLELTKGKRTEAQLRLQGLLVDDEISAQSEHLAQLTGLPARGLTTQHSSIPALRAPTVTTSSEGAETLRQMMGVSAAFSAARAKQFTADGERRYLLRPQIAFAANYARISTAFTSYEQYYPRFGANNNSFNSLSVGVQITVPLLDMVHRAKAREAAADAAHSLYEARLQQTVFLEGRSKLRRSTAELLARRDLATLDHDLAQDQLEAVTARLQAAAGTLGGDQLTPKDEANARLGERQRQLDVLNADLQLQQTEVTLMRQDGSLTTWLAASLPSVLNAPGAASPNPSEPAGVLSSPGVPNSLSPVPAVPATVGVEPSATPPSSPSSNPAPVSTPVPTVGTPPATLPASPVSTPTPPASSPGTPPMP